jgi:4-diphosphocytidyl-2-C-methyl-D-erythritol kinase
VTAAAFAPAKVNLWLRVTGRRADGYHLLDSLVVFAGVADRVRAEAADALSLAIDGPFASGLAAGEGNLVLRAARALATEAGVSSGARLHLTKNLPVASGIGGGSADAAAALRVLSTLWGVDPRHAAAVAPRLGADVPVCLAGRACRMQGVGEALTAVPAMPAFGLVLANPRVPLETRTVFSARSGGSSQEFPPRAWPDAAALAADIRAAGNDLQDAAIALCPPIADVLAALAALPGALAAQMSGSGATCFALFDSPAAAQDAAARLPAAWWRWGGALHEGQ